MNASSMPVSAPPKRGSSVGLTRHGKGSKILAICEANGLLISLAATSANPHENQLVNTGIDACPLKTEITKLIGDRGYDDDQLDRDLRENRGIELIAPNRCNRRHNFQDGRMLRRYRRRWLIERTFAWLHNYRRVVTRWERKVENWMGFIYLAASNILAKGF
jgi:transposase